jgi:hypothetical protein
MAMAAMTPMVLGACYGGAKDSGDTAFSGGGPAGTSVGDGTGTYGLRIQDDCESVWNIVGTHNGGSADYSWDAALTVDQGQTDCSGVGDTSGSLVASGGSVYFDNGYVGVATYTANTLSWQTSGYVTGGSGRAYSYAGNMGW